MNQVENFMGAVVDALAETQRASEARDHAAKKWQRSRTEVHWGEYLALAACWAFVNEENQQALAAI